jgi:N-acetylneuraminic acid mutarotase
MNIMDGQGVWKYIMKKHLFIIITIMGLAGCGPIICETPIFSPAPGTYNSDQHVSLSTTTKDAVIYYTIDDSAPTTNSNVYSSTIPVTGNGTVLTIKAIAAKSGTRNSAVASGTFTISSGAGVQQWTWVSGDNIDNQAGIYGTQGTASASNKPGARDGSMFWIDSSGQMWLFAGNGIDFNGSSGLLNDLWRFDKSAGEWTWVSGDDVVNQIGIFGMQGTGSSTDKPGARTKGVSWIDSSGNLWLFGGTGYASVNNGELNDLWKFEPSSGIWTWVSGENLANQSGIYGIKGTGSTSNVPGARDSGVSWIDSSGNLWLFGGTGYDFQSNGELNDLWKFEPSTGKWTWVSGDGFAGQPGIYGIKGTASLSGKPGARDNSVSWIDSSGNLWLFGGNGLDANGNAGFLNDLWKYDPSIGEWTWVSGDNTINQSGVYGTKGTSSTSDIPGSRDSSVSWIDASDNLWFFGGNGFDANGNGGFLNDLWKFNPTSGRWTWVSGNNTINQSSVYGTKGTASASNMPGSRETSVSWVDASGNLWLFGGGGFDAIENFVLLNDLWKFAP